MRTAIPVRGATLSRQHRRTSCRFARAAPNGVPEAAPRLRLDKQGDNLGMDRVHFSFDLRHCVLDLCRAEVVGEFETEGCDNLIGRELYCDNTVCLCNGILCARDTEDGVAELTICALAN